MSKQKYRILKLSKKSVSQSNKVNKTMSYDSDSCQLFFKDFNVV